MCLFKCLFPISIYRTELNKLADQEQRTEWVLDIAVSDRISTPSANVQSDRCIRNGEQKNSMIPTNSRTIENVRMLFQHSVRTFSTVGELFAIFFFFLFSTLKRSVMLTTCWWMFDAKTLF